MRKRQPPPAVSMLRSPDRPLYPDRDAVIGPIGIRERHRLARIALLKDLKARMWIRY
jgi:hypothetical protein